MKKQTVVIISGIFLITLFIVIAQVFVRRQSDVSLPQTKTQELLPPTEGTSVVFPTKGKEVGETTVIIDFGNGTRWTGKASGATVYEATIQFIRAKGATFEEKEYKFGKMIEKIGNLGNSKDSYWSFFVNNKAGRVAADKTAVYPNDTIEWRYVKQ